MDPRDDQLEPDGDDIDGDDGDDLDGDDLDDEGDDRSLDGEDAVELGGRGIDLRAPLVDDEDDSGLGAAFDEDEVEQVELAPPLSDDEADDLLTRFQRAEAELATRWPESKLEPSLERIRAVMDLLGDPHRAVPVIHLAGTNGKTSTARMIESVLRSFGLRTGLFTSPHLHSVRERVRLDGEAIDIERFVRVYEDIRPYVEIADATSERNGGPRLSFFEVMTAIAYAAFADAPVDVAVVEAGMGGAWDATNVADGVVAVVTPIDLDHMDYLGDTIAAIAGEKAGIIKDGATAVLAAQQLDAAEVLLARCAEVGATVAREGVEFGVAGRAPAVGGQVLSLQAPSGRYDDVFVPLFGAHQAANAAVALAAVESFLGGGAEQLNTDVLRAGFAAVASPGRLEVVRRGPTVLVDAAHNPHGARALAEAIGDSFEFTHLVGVVAVLSDKDARGLLEALEPVLATVVVTRSSSPRATDVDTLAAVAVEVFGTDRVEVADRLAEAIDVAIELADSAAADLGGTGVLVTGSVVTAAEARALLGRGEA
ncbi:MAG TPA: folylpolyglutamate synthase/dihydrofolate synthase family protein [Candidatus Nanopelagicales bacterium]|nr:folylpolyglutamate synthase/dihydrofolate synthase family protein [Candidatus Nanopelagicales bacterium]